MKTKPQTRLGKSRDLSHGMTLMEVLLALAVFALAAVALVSVMNQIGGAVIDARTVRNVEQSLESVLDEYSKMPALDDMKKELKPDKNGVGYSIVIQPMQNVKNKEGRTLQGLFRIQVTAKWKENGNPLEITADTIRNAALFQPVN